MRTTLKDVIKFECLNLRQLIELWTMANSVDWGALNDVIRPNLFELFKIQFFEICEDLRAL